MGRWRDTGAAAQQVAVAPRELCNRRPPRDAAEGAQIGPHLRAFLGEQRAGGGRRAPGEAFGRAARLVGFTGQQLNGNQRAVITVTSWSSPGTFIEQYISTN